MSAQEVIIVFGLLRKLRRSNDYGCARLSIVIVLVGYLMTLSVAGLYRVEI
jgi:hypothetical protein